MTAMTDSIIFFIENLLVNSEKTEAEHNALRSQTNEVNRIIDAP
jgi:hypothetical protein